MLIHKKSEEYFHQASEVIIGGVNSPSRSFKAVGGGAPLFMERGEGAYLYDVDGHCYIDYLCAFGPIILGHSHPAIVNALNKIATTGTLLGTPTPYETLFAQTIRQAIPSMERIRFVNTGTEGIMTAIRVARAYTGKTKIIKFAGCYHGHSDAVLVAAGSGPSTLGIPDSSGVPKSIAEEVITIPFNDIDAFKTAMLKWSDQLACILVEPIVGNFGIVLPQQGFLETISEYGKKNNILVIYDEVITAFRFHYGGVQNLYQIEPDLTILGKIIGGGLPIGAYGGKKEIMESVAPLGTTYQAGTMAGNPASIQTGIACLEVLSRPNVYSYLEQLGAQLEEGLLKAAAESAVPVQINRFRGALALYFSEKPITNYYEAEQSNSEQFALFFRMMLAGGVYLAPSKYEAWFITLAHTPADIEKTIATSASAFKTLKNI